MVGLAIVGTGEYGCIWLGTNWDREVEKGIQRNAEEAKRHAQISSSLPPSVDEE